MTEPPLEELVPAVVESTRPHLDKGLVALYVHGSCAGGETDAWSDLDVAAICADAAQQGDLFRDWVVALEERFEYRVDPVVAPRDELHQGGSWAFVFLRHSLLTRAELLLGEDIRAEVAPPDEHLVRLSAVSVAMTWLRRLYDLPRFYLFPSTLDGRSVQPLEDFGRGNAAWQFSTAVTKLVRAILLLDTGRFLEARDELLQAVAPPGREEEARCVQEALAVRREFPRFGEVDASAPALTRLAEAVPHLATRLFAAMGERDLVDPTFEGRGGGAYELDGTRKPEMPEPFALHDPAEPDLVHDHADQDARDGND
jgi:hypothetical protein